MAKGNRGGQGYAKYKANSMAINASNNSITIDVPNGYTALSNKEGDVISDYWYGGLNAKRISNKYITMDRVSEDENRIVVKVGDNHLIQTKYGYGLILDENHVTWLKSENVNKNYYGNEVVLNKQYFKANQWGDFSNLFGSEPQNLNFSEWLDVAKKQEKSGNGVKWEHSYTSPKSKAIQKNIAKKMGA